MNNDGFIRQTAEDYDMDFRIVKRIYEKYGRTLFYEKLEEYLTERANK